MTLLIIQNTRVKVYKKKKKNPNAKLLFVQSKVKFILVLYMDNEKTEKTQTNNFLFQAKKYFYY
jgi:heme/copper-type cytochrome/quinol oxidase subunit 4